MKTIGTILATAFVLIPWCLSPVLGQQNTSASEKKIVITKRTMDPDGTETTETIIKRGQAAEDFDVNQYVEENRADNVELDVRVQGGDVERNLVIRKQKDHQIDWSQNQNAFGGTSACDDNRAFLGVEEDSDERADKNGLVVDVVRGSAADHAGLRNNDIILSLDGQSVNTWDDLSKILGNAKPGDKMKIAYSRAGKSNNAEAVLSTRKAIKSDSETYIRGFMGINPSDNDDDGATNGVRIDVVKDSGAQKAGLKDGDKLLQLNDTPIYDWEDITDFMAYTKPDEKIEVTYQRNGKKDKTQVTLGAQKSTARSFNFGADWEPKEFNFDIKVKEKDACLGVYTSGYDEGETKGARISDFTDESAARESNMETGDVITAVNGVPVSGQDELWEQISTFQPGDKITVAFLRDAQPNQIEATLKACRDNSNSVFFYDNDESGPYKVREFSLWNWEDKDQNALRERRIITIHRSAEGDAPIVETPANNLSVPDRSLQLERFRAYPNPSQGQITVEFRSEPLPTIVSLLDMSGRQLFREELNAFSGDYYQQFDLSEYAKGAVIIHVLQGEKVFTEQIVIN